MSNQTFEHDVLSATGQLRSATTLLVMTLIGGTLGYYIIGRGLWSPLDCFYMTVITLTTVGYGEVLPIAHHAVARAFTIALLFTGMGVVLYFASAVTAFILDGDLRQLMRSRRMRKKIDELKAHIILCGVGQTGQHVLREMIESNAEVVIIDQNRERIEKLQRELDRPLLFIVGDADEDDVLIQAGIERCRGLVVSLGSDHDNLLCTITARTLNPKARIITRGSDPRAEQKFRRAGADRVIYTSVIGGVRIASELLRPQVVTFLDVMLRDKERQLRIEQMELNEHHALVGLSLAESRLRSDHNLLVIAIYEDHRDRYHYNPSPDFVLAPNHTLVVLGELSDIESLRRK